MNPKGRHVAVGAAGFEPAILVGLVNPCSSLSNVYCENVDQIVAHISKVLSR